MKRLSLQWRLTLMTAVLIAATCIFLNLALSRAGMFYMDKLGQAIFGIGCGILTAIIRICRVMLALDSLQDGKNTAV